MEIFFDQTAYSIFENAGMVTVTVKLSDTYNEDIVVNVAVGELKGRYIQENSDCVMWTVVENEVYRVRCHWLLACAVLLNLTCLPSPSGIQEFFKAQGMSK